jgi:hypothetical protein
MVEEALYDGYTQDFLIAEDEIGTTGPIGLPGS